MSFNQKGINFLIIISFILSSLLSIYYISKYDKYSEYKNNQHPMIKIAVQNHWHEAQVILDDVKNGKKFWDSGKRNADSFLPQKILALFYLVINEDLEENGITKVDNGKIYYLILKSLFYYFIIYLLCKRLSLIFSKRKVFFTVLFLALIPDLFQYHSSFWNESLFFSFQLLLIYFFLKIDEGKFYNNIALGITVGLMYSISEEYFIYIFFLAIIYIFIFKSKFFKPLLSLLIGYLLVLFLIFTSNSLKDRPAKVVAKGIKSAFYIYLVPNITSEKEKISINDSFAKLKAEAEIWAQNNDINYENENYILLKINNANENEQYLNYIFKKSLILILKNPLITFKKVFSKSLHTATLNPFYINYFYQYDGKAQFFKTETHKKLIPIRIIYSIIIYSIVIIGFFKFLNKSNNSLNIFLIISIFYVILSLGWMGNPRYFTPALIFMSIFFGNFFGSSSDSLYKTKKFNT